MGLEKIVRYTCSTKVSSFIPMVLNAVATVLLVVFGLVKYSMDDIEPAEKTLFFVIMLCAIVIVLSFTVYNAYRYKRPVDKHKVIILNKFLCRIYIKSKLLFVLLTFIAHVGFFLLLGLIVDWIDYGTVNFLSSFVEIVLDWIIESCILGLTFTTVSFNDYYSYFKSKQ
ncbi:hypothetical protein H6A66_07555 [Bacteroides caecigallinarum]|uniref:hypothetical protein n=2 Tax=Bacteroides TaxID=816 RepID=UPI001959BBD2|nr:hypothetical protein [Bacteroides caecigallinarum]MBM6865021.1 hypothetical protein [Bacteroides caecigallinarum]